MKRALQLSLASISRRYNGPYFRLLIALVALMLIEPLVSPSFLGRTIVEVLLTTVLISSLMAVIERKTDLALPVSYMVITLVSEWTLHLFRNPPWLELITPIFGLLLLMHVVGALLRHIFISRECFTADLLYGAVDIYLLLALIFAFLAALVEALAPGSYTGNMLPKPGEIKLMPYFYSSLNTLTGIGFVDLVPASRLALMLGFVEAIAGQMYLTILVALLVGMQISARAK